MKKLAFALLAVVLLMPVSALGQDTPGAGTAARPSVKSQRTSRKPATISGKVGEDGKTLTTYENILWTVTDPEILKEYQDQQVKVKCQIAAHPGANEIRVLSIKVIQTEIKYVANKGDSAFRR
jgi:hypothetical protein